MACAKITLQINQGETFYKRFEYKDRNGSPVDLSYYHSRMQIRPSVDSSTVIATLSSSISGDGTGISHTPISESITLPESSGSFSLTVSAYSSSLFNFNEAYADLFFYSGSGITLYADKVFEAKVKLVKSVTRS